MSINITALIEKAGALKGCLSHLKTTASRRRCKDEEDRLPMGNPFVSDEARLLSTKAYRLLDCKTQVFTSPSNRLTRTRGTHVREVQAVSVVASEMLGLNTDLIRAAAIGHDIGHGPLGHQGEEWIAKEMRRPFCHEVMGPIVVQKIERKGKGINACYETLEAMMRHSGNTAIKEMSAEAWTLRHTDKFSYIFHDVNDIGIRMGYRFSPKLNKLINEFGKNQRERTTTALAGLIIESAELGYVSFEQLEIGKKFQELRRLMYEVYVHVTQQDVSGILGPVLDFLKMIKIGDPFLLLALMTDEDVLKISHWSGMKDITLLNQTAIKEIVPHLHKIGPIDLCSPYLDW